MLIDELIAFVNAQISFQETRAKNWGPLSKTPNEKIYESALNTLSSLRDLIEYLEEQQRATTPVPRSLGDISDLPAELVKELSVKRLDELETQILAIMRSCDGEANLDQVLVGLYRSYKVVQTRRFVQNKLYRMSQKGIVFAIHGQRAAYSLEQQPETEAEFQVRMQEQDDEVPF